MNTLPYLIAAGRIHFINTHRKPPMTLALGRWDARELARVAVAHLPPANGIKPSKFLRMAREGITAWDARIQVDGRIGRMPAALWWHE